LLSIAMEALMRRLALSLVIFLSTIVSAPDAVAASTTRMDPALASEIEALSASLMKDGPGWKAYAEVLHDDYSRSSTGGEYQRRAEFLKGLQEWWDYGMRVSSRQVEPIAYDRTGNVAIVRSKVTETFVGPDGATSGFTGHVTYVWVLEDNGWKLLTAAIEDVPAR
jgi:ketosteroid isomerase-like protein